MHRESDFTSLLNIKPNYTDSCLYQKGEHAGMIKNNYILYINTNLRDFSNKGLFTLYLTCQRRERGCSQYQIQATLKL